MAGFLGKLFGRKDEQREKLERIMAAAESQDHDFSVFRRTMIACIEVGRGYMDRLKQCGDDLTKAMNRGDQNAFWAEHARTDQNSQLINLKFSELKDFMEGKISSGGLSSDVRANIADLLDQMGEHSTSKMCRDNDDRLYTIMKIGLDKTTRLLQENGLGHMLNRM